MKLFAPSVTDGYKLGHGGMYADGTTMVYSNLTPRTDKIYRRNATRFYDGFLVAVGMEAAIAELHEIWEEFFNMEKPKAVARFKRRVDGYLGPDAIDFSQLEALHGLGFLPLIFKALPEGSLVPMGTPIITMYNTLPGQYWLVNFNETLLSSLTWKTATNATIAREYAAMGKYFGELTGVDEFTRSIQFHDFSARGMSGPEDAARAGFGHLTQFIGTDTLAAMDYAEDYYEVDGLLAISVPATEHAVATSNILFLENQIQLKGVFDNSRLIAETEFMRDLITRKFPTGIVSYVADSFDFWAVLTEILPALKDVILAREASAVAPGKLVIRPDSGDPVEVICGIEIEEILAGNIEDAKEIALEAMEERVRGETEFAECGDSSPEQYFRWNGKVYLAKGDFFWNRHDKTYYYLDDASLVSFEEVELSAEQKGAIEVLWDTFGGSVNEKGFKVLDPHIGLIYGDSITTKRALEIFERLVDKGFSTGNVVFGVGSYTYQCNTRDTFGFAVKATYTEVEGEGIAIFKDPKTDSKKKSAKGLLFVDIDTELDGLPFCLQDDVSWKQESSAENLLRPVYINGTRVRKTKLSEIRERCKA